jgi:hypothetical protein
LIEQLVAPQPEARPPFQRLVRGRGFAGIFQVGKSVVRLALGEIRADNVLELGEAVDIFFARRAGVTPVIGPSQIEFKQGGQG